MGQSCGAVDYEALAGDADAGAVLTDINDFVGVGVLVDVVVGVDLGEDS